MSSDEQAGSVREALFVRLTALEFAVKILAADSELPPTFYEDMDRYILASVYPPGEERLPSPTRRRMSRKIERQIRALLNLPTEMDGDAATIG